MKKTAALLCIAATLSLCLAPPAQAGTLCLYLMLVETHEITARCGDRLPADAEARFQKLSLDLARYNVRNTPSMNGHIEPEAWRASMIKKLQSAPLNPDTCTKRDYAAMKKVITDWTTPEYMKKFEDSLQKPSNPEAGGCL